MSLAMFDWWELPQLRTEGDENIKRKATWLELFYDLVFVGVVAELSQQLARDVSWSGLGTFVLLFVAAWWTWLGSTFYNQRFERDDVSHRLFTFMQMIPLAGMAVFAHGALDARAVGFVWSYVLAQVVLMVMWWRGGLHDPIARPMTNRFLIGLGAAAALWLLSLLFGPTTRIVLWVLGLAISLFMPILTLRYQEEHMPSLEMTHLTERMGLFVVLVLGESIIGAIHGVAGTGVITKQLIINGVLGMALTFSLWWSYFDHVAKRTTKTAMNWAAAWGYGHLPLMMALTAVGAGMLNIVADGGGILDDPMRWLIVLSVAGSLLAMGLLEITLVHDERDRAQGHRHHSAWFHFGAAAVALLIGFGGVGFSSTLVLGLLVVLGWSQTIIGRDDVEDQAHE